MYICIIWYTWTFNPSDASSVARYTLSTRRKASERASIPNLSKGLRCHVSTGCVETGRGLWLTVWMILGGYLEQRRKCFLVAVHCRSYLLCYLKVRVTFRSKIQSGRFDLTCWLMRTIAISFRWVNSWNAASIPDICVSGLIRECEMI